MERDDDVSHRTRPPVDLSPAGDDINDSWRHYQILYETMQQGVIYWDSDGRIVSMNPAAERILGYTREELLQQAPHEYERACMREDGSPFPSSEQPSVVAMRTGLEVRDVSMAVYNPREGRHRWITISAMPLLRAGESLPCRVYTIFHDVTESRRSREALRESEEKFTVLVRDLCVGVLIHAPDTRILFCNRMAQDLLGLKAEQLLGEPVNRPDIRFWQEDASPLPSEEHPVSQVLRTGQPVENIVMGAWNLSTGRVSWHLVSASPVFDSSGSIAQVIATMADLTERRLIDQEIRASRQQLRLLAARLSASLENERTTIARRVHDDLGQRLTALRIDAVTLMRLVPPDDAPSRARLQGMLEELDSATDTVQAIAVELRPGVLDDLGLGPALEWEAERFSRRTGIRCYVEARIPDRSPGRHLSTAFYRIFQEILANVARHSRATRVDVNMCREGSDLVMSVQDDGVGITKEQVSHRNSIGIAGMRERVEPFGGQVQFQSEPGRGTRVVVRVAASAGNDP